MNSVAPVAVNAYRKNGAAMAFPIAETAATRGSAVPVTQALNSTADQTNASTRSKYAMVMSIARMVAMNACAVSTYITYPVGSQPIRLSVMNIDALIMQSGIWSLMKRH